MIEEIFLLQRLDYLISVKKTGTRRDLARRFGVSERTISRYISIMNSLGSQIVFCRTCGSFKYAKPGKFIIEIGFRPQK